MKYCAPSSSPASSFEQKLRKSQQVARGRAGTITYDVKASTVRLNGDAWLTMARTRSKRHADLQHRPQRVAANPDATTPGGVKITINRARRRPRPHPRPAPRPPPRIPSRRVRIRLHDAAGAETLGKSYRARRVVNGLRSSAVGEIVGLLGPNGAGKTTAFYMIVGSCPATRVASGSTIRSLRTCRCTAARVSASVTCRRRRRFPQAFRRRQHRRDPRDTQGPR